MAGNFWARIKPYNPKRGHFLKRLHCMGRLFRGGDGIEEIPEWVEVNRPQGEALMEFKQNDNDAFSQRAFDIVTPELRKRIDQKENEFRMTMLGRGMAISEMPDVSASESSLVDGQSQRKRLTLDDLASGNSDEGLGEIASAGAARSAPRRAQESSALPPDSDLAGRAAASEGFDEDTLDMNDGDDDDDDGDEGEGAALLEDAKAAATATQPNTVASSLPPTAPPPPAPKPARPPKRGRGSK